MKTKIIMRRDSNLWLKVYYFWKLWKCQKLIKKLMNFLEIKQIKEMGNRIKRGRLLKKCWNCLMILISMLFLSFWGLFLKVMAMKKYGFRPLNSWKISILYSSRSNKNMEMYHLCSITCTFYFVKYMLASRIKT